MYKILITTTSFINTSEKFSSSVPPAVATAVHTTVVEFDTPEEAIFAVRKINGLEYLRCTQNAITLFDTEALKP